jgi:hypothetical protein
MAYNMWIRKNKIELHTEYENATQKFYYMRNNIPKC